MTTHNILRKYNIVKDMVTEIKKFILEVLISTSYINSQILYTVPMHILFYIYVHTYVHCILYPNNMHAIYQALTANST